MVTFTSIGGNDAEGQRACVSRCARRNVEEVVVELGKASSRELKPSSNHLRPLTCGLISSRLKALPSGEVRELRSAEDIARSIDVAADVRRRLFTRMPSSEDLGAMQASLVSGNMNGCPTR